MFTMRIVEIAGNIDSHRGSEDLEFWWRVAAYGGRFAYTEQPLIERHKDTESVTSKPLQFLPGSLHSLELCEQTSRRFGQSDLLPALHRAKHRTWCGLIRAYALEGERQKALECFAQSLRYGVSQQAFVYTAAALAGPAAIEQAKRIRRAFTKGEQTS